MYQNAISPKKLHMDGIIIHMIIIISGLRMEGPNPYMEEPTLEILTKEYDVIIFKHCFPGSRILEDTGNPDINSDEKRIENYKLQYNALKQKMHEFPNNKFIVWTPAVNTKNQMTEDEAKTDC